ncbi:MAG: DUF255 domain-containing protein [Planctomycetes bacterium]|nr:DUF255 domain-containing protein [Planctomycetota bacterium]MCH9724995.1 DUF255 domain-containing protein [Planctomycetota bacterium]MCH9777544.1 DUF255 domain-containing protein [Planctomycetota bacterium]MCH9791524.1 DUF255 domain-containing protein [Planctomycetota bacterium]
MLSANDDSKKTSKENSSESTDTKLSDSKKESPTFTNRLAKETSPYLLLHKHNPVDWYPWGPAAFEKAEKENKIIFLSIGYSSCYWCHVMERLVFENPKIAEYMNKHFVNIKVDREERPDIDDIYMTSLHVYFQLIGAPGNGGWPLSMFLTPDREPFAGGTYFPPTDEGGRMSFPRVLQRVHELWTEDKKQVSQSATIIAKEVARLQKEEAAAEPIAIESKLVKAGVRSVNAGYDAEFGGIDFSKVSPNSPKFPTSSKLVLLQYDIQSSDSDTTSAESAKVLYHTLTAMANGGIYDHLGGGFHRYSTDRYWHVPHFEKMLYDNGQLASLYANAFDQTGNVQYKNVTEGIIDFVLRELTDSQGGFYSALDAETDGIEGEHYAWSQDELKTTLGDDYTLFAEFYGLNEPSRFEHGYVLHRVISLDEFAKKKKTTPAALESKLEAMRQKLHTIRNKRKSLLKDDKILTSWNGLMIEGMATAGRVLKRPDYTTAAEKAAQFILDNMRDEKGHLYRSYRAGQARLNAYLDDYAFLVRGLLALYQTTGKQQWLDQARQLTDLQIELFWDQKEHGFFFTTHDHEKLIARTKNAYDSAIPSGNSISTRNLILLSELTKEPKYHKYANQTLQLFGRIIKRYPGRCTQLVQAVGESLASTNDGKQSAISTPVDDFIPTDDFVLVQESQFLSSETVEQLVAVNPGVELLLAAGLGQTSQKKKLVSAKAYLSVDKLPAGKTCQVAIVLNIEKGWHINTNPSSPDFLVPTTFTIKSIQNLKLSKVKYPAGHAFEVEGFEQPLQVYEKQAIVRGVLEIPAEAGGKEEQLELNVKYQACNDKTCIRPTTVSLKGKFRVAKPGEPIKQINQQWFQPSVKN